MTSGLQAPAEPVETVEYQDGFTRERFGDSVMVTTYLGIPAADDSDDEPEPEPKPHGPYMSISLV